MRYLLHVIAVFSFILFQACSNIPTEIQQNSPIEFQQNLKASKGLLIDVRTPEEYVEGHIAGSATIDFYSPDFESKLGRLDRNKALFLYCASGIRSGKASKMAHTLGFVEIHNLKGGLNAWEDDQLPIER